MDCFWKRTITLKKHLGYLEYFSLITYISGNLIAIFISLAIFTFQAYEKGIALFKWPNVYDIWNTYLTKFLKRYGGTKLERTRDLFEQCLEHCPPKYAKGIKLVLHSILLLINIKKE